MSISPWNLPIEIWINHLVPLLPLQTVVIVSTLLNKDTSRKFKNYQELTWYSFINSQHVYLKGIKVACEFYYTEEKAITWMQFLKNCVSCGSGKQSYASMIGRCHYRLSKGGEYDLIADGLTDLETLRNEIGLGDYAKFFEKDTGLWKFDDLFNSFTTYIAMFDPGFAPAYMQGLAELRVISKRIQQKVELDSLKGGSSLDVAVQHVVSFLQKGFSSEYDDDTEDIVMFHMGTNVFRYIKGWENRRPGNVFYISFLIFHELMHRLGHTIAAKTIIGGPDQYTERFYFSFQFQDDDRCTYVLAYNWGELKIEKIDNASQLLIKLKSRFEESGYGQKAKFGNARELIMPEYYWGSIMNVSRKISFNSFQDIFVRGREDLHELDTEYGIIVYPPCPIVIPHPCATTPFETSVAKCPSIGTFVISSSYLCVVLGYLPQQKSYRCLDTMNNVIIESEANIDFKREFDEEELQNAHGIFKYNTLIGRFFKSYRDNRFTDCIEYNW